MAKWLEERALGPELLPGVLALAVFVAWAASEGGYAPTSWYPGALFIAGLLAVVLVAMGRRGGFPRSTLVAIALAIAFAIWCFVSITWADAQGDAWDGANRALLYATVFALFAALPWTSRSALGLMGLYSVAIAVVAGTTVIDLSSAADPSLMLIDDRLAAPTGYHNATAALFLAAAFPAAFLASRREVPWPARGVLLAAGGLLVQVAILSQSRGSSIALPLTLLVYVVVVPDRVRALGAVAAIAAFSGLAAPALLDVYSVGQDGGDLGAAVDDAGGAVAISTIALLVVGCVLGFADGRLRPSARTSQIVTRIAGGAWIAAGVAALAAGLIAIGNPVDWAEERWDDFKSGQQDQGESRFGGSLGTNRYDFWRVAMNEFADSPAGGLGIEQFAAPYVRERESDEEPTHPHSLPVRVISQTGLIGTAMFAGFLAAALAAALAVRRHATTLLARAAPAIAFTAFAYWFIHASADWMWAFPALTAPAFAWLGMAGRVADPPADTAETAEMAAIDGPERHRPRALGIAVVAAVAAAFVVAAGSYVLPWGAARDVERATEIWQESPQTAYDRLDRAADLNFLSERPDLIAGAIAVRHDELATAEAAFHRAVGRNDTNWYALLELGAVQAARGDFAEARGNLARARDLNPTEPVTPQVLRAARANRAYPLARIDRQMLERVCSRVGRTEETRYCAPR